MIPLARSHDHSNFATLGDSDDSIRWLVGSTLGLLGGATVVHTLAAFLKQAETPEAQQEAIKALQRIVDNPREDKQVRQMAERLATAQRP